MKSAEMYPTPPHVVDAIQAVAAWMRRFDCPECRIAPTGGATFAVEAHTAEMEQLYMHIAALEADIAGCIESQQTLIRGSIAHTSAAILAERERCAKIAEHLIPSGFGGSGKAGDSYATARDDRARTIAAMIRGVTP